MKQSSRDNLIKAAGILEGVYYCCGSDKVNNGLVTVIEILEDTLNEEDKLMEVCNNDRRADH